MIFDTHAHYDDEAFDGDRESLLNAMKENGIGRIVNVGANIETTKKSIELASQYDFIYTSAGVHPSDVKELNRETFGWLAETVNDDVSSGKYNGKIAAIGEIGLDYYWDKEADVRNNQKVWFERQLELARAVKLPVIIHSRDAAKDTYDLMKALHSEDIGGVIHCYSYSKEMARDYLNMGFFLGIGGVLTFKNARVLKEVATYAPMEQIVLETDSPYLAPIPYRGKRNSSLNLPYVIAALSEIKHIPEEEIVNVTWENGKRLYRMAE